MHIDRKKTDKGKKYKGWQKGQKHKGAQKMRHNYCLCEASPVWTGGTGQWQDCSLCSNKKKRNLYESDGVVKRGATTTVQQGKLESFGMCFWAVQCETA